jgi:hypothetical protein
MGFDASQSIAWREIRTRFGDSLVQTELLSLAQVICSEIGIQVDREAKRRKEVLIKWFDENYSAIRGILSKIEMEDVNGRPLTPRE